MVDTTGNIGLREGNEVEEREGEVSGQSPACPRLDRGSIAAGFREACERFDDWSVADMPIGMVGIAGNSVDYVTGGWRSERPVWDEVACKQCLLCWVNCPDSSVTVADGLMTGIDYEHCKGCGICVVECRFNALTMAPEHGIEDQIESSAEAEPEITEGA
jgi:pyruvate ferredoxin oxidoreductase delta subunit